MLVTFVFAALQATSPASAPAPALTREIELVETAPLETTLDHDWLRDADQVWREMKIGRASCRERVS
jgi:hypothetical protein